MSVDWNIKFSPETEEILHFKKQLGDTRQTDY